jgi:pimeloyl-ACP methyl ester carboxylesterase
MGRRMADVEFRLLLDHDEFTPEVQFDFRKLLAEVTVCDVDDIRIRSIRTGCINVRVTMPDDAAKQFLEMYWQFLQANRDLENIPEPLRSFLATYKVDDFTGRVDIDIHVKSNPKNRAVIFVHGWTGDNNTFGKWPAFLWDEFRCQSAVFEYPTGVFSHSPSNIYVGEALANWVRNNFQDTKLALVAHSLGGIVVRRFIVSAQEQRDERLDFNVRNIAFVASPHNGTVLASAASKIPFIDSEQVQELKQSSAVLYDLNIRWSKWVNHYVPKTCHLQSLFGTKDKVVTSVNAIGTSEDVIPILGRDHTDIVKPATPTDEVVRTVARFLINNSFFKDDPREDAQRRRDVAEINRAFYGEPAVPTKTDIEHGPLGTSRSDSKEPRLDNPFGDG